MAAFSPVMSGGLVSRAAGGRSAGRASAGDTRIARASPPGLLRPTREVALRIRGPYLLASTALAELALFVGPPDR